MSGGAPGLAGCRVLMVEDEALQSMLVRALLEALGCVVVASAARFADAAHKCETLEYDVALLDVNLRGDQTFSIADALRARAQPFVLVTGYGADVLPDRLRDAPLLQKPYRQEELGGALRDALRGR